MREYKNECCDCATPGYPCEGELCPNRNVLHIYCDVCGEDIDPDDGIYLDGNEEVCKQCLLDAHRTEI